VLGEEPSDELWEVIVLVDWAAARPGFCEEELAMRLALSKAVCEEVVVVGAKLSEKLCVSVFVVCATISERLDEDGSMVWESAAELLLVA